MSLENLTNEELWQLFPVVLSEHKTAWKDWFQEEKKRIIHIVGIENIEQISHIGSTYIPNLIAKPTIDILLEIKDKTNIEQLIATMVGNGYIYLEQPANPAPHIVFYKGYTPYGFDEQVFHIHVRYAGDWDELLFRDYLLNHPDIASQYQELKINLQQLHKYNRDAYTDAKTDFIKNIVRQARTEKANTKQSTIL